jgi:hypothetical protein
MHLHLHCTAILGIILIFLGDAQTGPNSAANQKHQSNFLHDE